MSSTGIPFAPGPLARRLSGTRGQSIANVGVKFVATGLAFGVNLALARNMSPDAFGEVSVALAWLGLATAVGCLSTPLVLMRFVGASLADGRPDLARGVIRACVLVAAASSIVLVLLASAWLAVAGPKPFGDAATVPALCIALIVPNALLTTVTAVLQALRHAIAAEVIGSVLRSVLLLAAFAGLWLLPGRAPFSPGAVLEAYLGVAILLLGFADRMARRVVRTTIAAAPPAYAHRRWSVAGAGLMTVLLAAAANERIDLLLLDWRASGSEVASYAVAQRFAQIMLFAANAVGAVMAPHFVVSLVALRDGEGRFAQKLVRSSARLTVALYAAAWLFFVVVGPWLMSLFGPHYASAHVPLLILIGGQAVASLSGPGTLVATLSGHSRLALVALLISIGVNAALNVYAVPRYGAVGAAAATATAGIVGAVIASVRLRRSLGIRIDALPIGVGRRFLAGSA